MPTERTSSPLVSIHCKHECEDKKHSFTWQEGDSAGYLMFVMESDTKHGPYCHWCGECLEEEASAAE